MTEEEPPPPPMEASARRGRAPSSFKGTFTNRNREENQNEGRPRFRSGGARLFVGNLESEKISKDDFKQIFEQYGEVLEVSMHRSYGFVQFTNEESMLQAMEKEQGRMIGSRAIDVQRAKQSERRNNASGRFAGNKRRREIGRDRDYDRDNSRRRNHNYNKHLLPPKNGAVMKIILLGEMQRNFAQRVADKINDNRIPVELEMLDGRTLSQALRDAESNRSRYVCIVGRENISKGTTTIKLLHLKEDRGRCPTYDLPTNDLVDLVIEEERKLGFDAGPQAPLSYGGVNPQNSLAAQNLVGLNSLPTSNGMVAQNSVQPNIMFQMQQQIAALSQQLSSFTQQPQGHALPQQPPQSTGPSAMQHKILEELNRLQQQTASLEQLGHAPLSGSSSYANSNPQPYSTTNPHPNNASSASPAQLQNLSKLLSSIQKLKGEKNP